MMILRFELNVKLSHGVDSGGRDQLALFCRQLDGGIALPDSYCSLVEHLADQVNCLGLPAMTETQIHGQTFGFVDDLPCAECCAAHPRRQRLCKAVKNQVSQSPVFQRRCPRLMCGPACKTQLHQPHQILRRRISVFRACEPLDAAPGIKSGLAFRTVRGQVCPDVFADFGSANSTNKISPRSFRKMLHSYPHTLWGCRDQIYLFGQGCVDNTKGMAGAKKIQFTIKNLDKPLPLSYQ